MHSVTLNFNNKETAAFVQQIAFYCTELTTMESRGVTPRSIHALGSILNSIEYDLCDIIKEQVKLEAKLSDPLFLDSYDDYEF